MKEFFEFMSGSPFLTFFLACIAYYVIHELLKFLVNRPLRHASIRRHGWPPAHCDADGDFKVNETD